MPNSDWTKQTYRFRWLESKASEYDWMTSVVDWFKGIGLIPASVTYRKPENVRLGLDPERIEAGYLAACAYEWDSWGPSSPVDFVNAIRCELRGTEQRDLIAGLLTLLGREQEEAVDAA